MSSGIAVVTISFLLTYLCVTIALASPSGDPEADPKTEADADLGCKIPKLILIQTSNFKSRYDIFKDFCKILQQSYSKILV